MKRIQYIAFFIVVFGCTTKTSNERVANMLAYMAKSTDTRENPYSSTVRMKYYDSLSRAQGRADIETEMNLANAYLEMGKEEESINVLEKLLKTNNNLEVGVQQNIYKTLAISWLRVGERSNCIANHALQSCIFPIKGNGVHVDQSGSENAIKIYKQLLQIDSTDLEARWLMNIAYMTIGGYPRDVPAQYLVKTDNLDSGLVKPFTDVAMNLGLNTNNLAGGGIVEDFDNDGYFDVVTSSWSLKQGMHFFRNNGDGTFTDIAEKAGIRKITGGLNMMQTDFNNDGWKDIFIVRGAWMQSLGKEPKSLLRNNGDGTFTEVTEESGIISFKPSQTATWADFNNDGWLDVYIGHESSVGEVFTSEFYINNKNGTFTECSEKAGIFLFDYVKGVTSGDFDNDGLMDIFISSFDGNKYLYRNTGIKNGLPQFKNISEEAGFSKNRQKTFSTWFWDYDNDGWLDILICGYRFSNSLAMYSAAEAMGKTIPGQGKVILYRNERNGKFKDVSDATGLTSVAFAMSSNFGDIDNDGYLDFYLGTGNPHFTSLVPNKLFKNIDGSSFKDVTSAGRVGNLQKGHSISMADLNNDGNIDIHIEMGGSFEGDHYQNSLYLNPGQNDNKWINLDLKGTTANSAAIGARIKVFFSDNGRKRTVFRDVNSGSSFGVNPLLQHIGLGNAQKVDSVEIQWPGSHTKQTVINLNPNTTYTIIEGSPSPTHKKVKILNFNATSHPAIGCAPEKL